MSVLLSSNKEGHHGLIIAPRDREHHRSNTRPLKYKTPKINKMFYESLKCSIDIILLERFVYNLENELQNISK